MWAPKQIILNESRGKGKLCCVIHKCIHYLKLISLKFSFTTPIWTLITIVCVCVCESNFNKVATVPKCPQVKTNSPATAHFNNNGLLVDRSHPQCKTLNLGSLPSLPPFGRVCLAFQTPGIVTERKHYRWEGTFSLPSTAQHLPSTNSTTPQRSRFWLLVKEATTQDINLYLIVV